MIRAFWNPDVERRRWSLLLRQSVESATRPPQRPPAWAWLVAAIVCFLLGFYAGTAYAAEPAVTLLVRPTAMLTRGDIHVEVRVPRHPDNRVLSIAWSSIGAGAGESQRPLEGADAPVLHELNLPSQPAAHYLFVATVFNGHGQPRGRAHAQIRVPEDGDDGRRAPGADR